ncbi:MAG: tetratricopeptide repeat protein [Planctomycetes bacterium]|nr:tetratricopeptide repeat protein [Planctomycetota bacterium]
MPTEPSPKVNDSHRLTWLLPLLLAATVTAYRPAFTAPFVFDDLGAIPANSHIRQLWPLSQALTAPDQTTLSGRPLASLSFALNYAVGGLDVRGYHAVNLFLHLASSVVLFALVRRTLQCPALRERYGRSASSVALAVTALWTLHPLQTESVIYIVQRTELLMAFFLLLTLHCSLRGAGSSRAWPWHLAAVLCCALGMASKEVMAAAPLIVLLHDGAFISPSFRAALTRRPAFYCGLALTWGLLAVLLIGIPRGDSVGFGHGITALDYLKTQAGVILWYLRLSFWPHPLVISYDDWPIARSFGEAILPGAIVLALLAASLWALLRRPPLGFLGASFFLILAPTSSFVPILTEVAAERRMYLPLAVPIALCVMAGDRLLRQRMVSGIARRLGPIWLARAVVIILAAALACFTYTRAQEYHSDLTIWEDAVAKRSQNALAHINLGNVLFRRGDIDKAIPSYETALALKPDDAQAHYNYANALAARDWFQPALRHYEEALRLDPCHADAHHNLGIALFKLGRVDAGLDHCRSALRLSPNHVGACNSLGLALAKQRRFDEALRYYRKALAIEPNATAILRNLGDVLLDMGRLAEAEAAYRQILAQDFDLAGVHCNLGITLAMQNRKTEAIAELRVALRLEPNNAGARRVLEDLLRP